MKNWNRNLLKKAWLCSMVMIMGGILFLAGCDLQSSSSDSTSGTNTDTGTPPPSQLVGTAALAGESATYTLTPASSPSSSVIGRKALYTVSGNIRYRGTDFSVTGTYANYAPEAGNGTFSGTISGSTLTITTATNSGLPVVFFSGKVSATSLSGTWRITLTTEEGNATYGGVWSGAAATTEGDPHTPSSADPLDSKFSLLSDFTDPVRGIVLKANGTITSIYQMPAGDLLKVTVTMSFGNSPIASLSMDIDVNKQAQSISGSITIDGTPVTDISVLKNFFFITVTEPC